MSLKKLIYMLGASVLLHVVFMVHNSVLWVTLTCHQYLLTGNVLLLLWSFFFPCCCYEKMKKMLIFKLHICFQTVLDGLFGQVSCPKHVVNWFFLILINRFQLLSDFFLQLLKRFAFVILPAYPPSRYTSSCLVKYFCCVEFKSYLAVYWQSSSFLHLRGVYLLVITSNHE